MFEYGNAGLAQAQVLSQANAVQAPALSRDAETLFGRLQEAAERLQKIGDMLHGPVPRDAAGGQLKGGPPEANSLRRILDLCAATTTRVIDEIMRIERNI